MVRASYARAYFDIKTQGVSPFWWKFPCLRQKDIAIKLWKLW